MQPTITLTENNFNHFAIANYFSDTHINTEEFAKSLKILTYINRLLKKESKINHRLILNHIIITKNTFGIPASIKLLLFKVEKESYVKLITYLNYLGYISEKQVTIDVELFDLLNNL